MNILQQFSKPLRTGISLLTLLFITGYLLLPPSVLLQQGIAHRILRLHVIANSDSSDDQQVKLKVRNGIISSLRNSMQEASSSKEAETLLASQLTNIEATADQILKDQGFSYQSKAKIGWEDFPQKEYGDLSFPSGSYRALTVRLGSAEGHNWWCVLFPTLCFTDETYDVITPENKEQFRDILTPEEYAEISSCNDANSAAQNAKTKEPGKPGESTDTARTPDKPAASEKEPKILYKSYFSRLFH